MKIRRVLSAAIVLILMLTALPSPIRVYADTNASAMNLLTNVLGDGCNTDSAATLYYGGKAWRVITYNHSSATLLASTNLDQTQFDESGNYSNEYANSTLKTKVDAIASGFTAREQGEVIKKTLASGSYDGDNTDCVAGVAIENALLWPLSTKEANQVDPSLRIVDPEHQSWATSFWWLRSPGDSDDSAAVVSGDGDVYHNGYGVDDTYGVRPAFELNLQSVLFTSAAAGGKSSGDEGADALAEVGTNSGNEWKVTLHDSTHSNFAVSSVTGDSSAVTISYSGAVTGDNEFISAVITNSVGVIKYYGRIAAVSNEAGSVTINLSGKLGESDQLFVFNEQCNGDKATDYAGELREIQIPEKPKLTITVKDQTYEYNGKLQGEEDVAYADPAEIAEKVKIEGLLEGDELTSVVLDGQGQEVGEYQIEITGFSINGDSANKKYEVTRVPGRLTITEPAPTIYNVTVSAEPQEGGTASANPTSGPEGTEVTLKAAPKSGYEFKEWQVITGGVSVTDAGSAETTLTIGTANVEVKAVFEEIPAKVFTVTFDSNGGSGTMDAAKVNEGEKYSLPENGFTAPENKEFDKWDAGAPGDLIEVTGDITVKAVWKDEPTPEPEPEPVPTAEYHHEHNYVWQVTREATPTVDGEMVYACTECGAVAQRLPISGYIAFNEDAAAKIRNAKSGQEVVITTEKWISFYSVVWNELAKRPDVRLVIDYKDNGKMYEVVIPPAASVSSLMNEEGYAGFLFLSGKFGRQQIRVY